MPLNVPRQQLDCPARGSKKNRAQCHTATEQGHQAFRLSHRGVNRHKCAACDLNVTRQGKFSHVLWILRVYFPRTKSRCMYTKYTDSIIIIISSNAHLLNNCPIKVIMLAAMHLGDCHMRAPDY